MHEQLRMTPIKIQALECDELLIDANYVIVSTTRSGSVMLKGMDCWDACTHIRSYKIGLLFTRAMCKVRKMKSIYCSSPFLYYKLATVNIFFSSNTGESIVRVRSQGPKSR